MRKVSCFLLRQLRPRSRIALSSLSISDSFSHLHSLSSTPNGSHFERFFKTQAHASVPLNFTRNPSLSRNFNTLADQASKLPSRQRKIKERSQLEEAFESAKTIDDMLKAFEAMVAASFDESELGLACLKLGLALDQEGEDPEKALSFATRALKVFDKDDRKPSLPLSMNLQLLGSLCFSLRRFNDSMGYLNRANRVLHRLEEEGSCSADDIKPILHAVHLELFNVKTAIGRREEAIGNLRKSLELKEMMLGEDSREVGKANRDVAEAYVAVLNFKEALPFCLKALEIHKMQLGGNSLEVAHDRRLLGIIYTGLEEHDKALQQNQLSQGVFKSWNRSSELLRGEIDAANMQIALGRYDEAINTLRAVVHEISADSQERALVFVSMAKALCNQEKFADSKRCLVIAADILRKKEISSPVAVSEAYIEISMQYETMDEFETAVSLLKKAQALIEKIAEEQHSVGSISARIGWLLLLTGKVEEAIPYLEDAAERLKESFGSKHYGVGYIYNNLGAAYLELNRPQSAAQVFAYAKDIMDFSLGPHHADSIDACRNLSKAYDAMGSYQLAINFQEKVIEAWEGHGPTAEDELKEAEQELEQLKKKALGASSNEALMKALPLAHTIDAFSAKNSEQGVSVTGRPSS